MLEKRKKFLSVILIIAMIFTNGGMSTLASSPSVFEKLTEDSTNEKLNTSYITSSDDGADLSSNISPATDSNLDYDDDTDDIDEVTEAEEEEEEVDDEKKSDDKRSDEKKSDEKSDDKKSDDSTNTTDEATYSDVKPSEKKPKKITESTLFGDRNWDYIWLGTYPQNDSRGAQEEPIKWRVLSKDDSEALLISDNIIDGGVYADDNEGTTIDWKNSSARRYLNENFKTKAFTSEQIENYILYKDIITEGSEDTNDQVFILSKDEIKDLFGSESLADEGSYNERSRVTIPCTYWLRAQGTNQDDLVVVAYGEFKTDLGVFGALHQIMGLGYRPSLYIDLTSQLFKESDNTVTWDLGDTSFKNESSLWNDFDRYQGGQKLPTSENIVKENGSNYYTFSGWRINNSDKVYTEIPEDQTGDIILTPVWTDFEYEIRYYRSKTSDEVLHIATRSYTEEKALDFDYETTGYNSRGWKNRSNDETLSKVDAYTSTDIEVYPELEEKIYEIRYFAEKNSNEVLYTATRSYTERKAVDWTYEYEITGYHISGWKNKEDDNTLSEVAENTANDIEVYPALDENIYEIRYYRGKNYSSPVKVATRSYTEAKTLDTSPSWNVYGYSFKEWRDKTTDEVVSRVAGNTDKNVEVYPQWEYTGNDVIWFGTYPQNDETGTEAEPIKWRVIKQNSDEMYLIADSVLDSQYWITPKAQVDGNVDEPVKYTYSHLFDWVNGTFKGQAFTNNQVSAILSKVVFTRNAQVFILAKDELGLLEDSDVKQFKYTPYARKNEEIHLEDSGNESQLSYYGGGAYNRTFLYPYSAVVDQSGQIVQGLELNEAFASYTNTLYLPAGVRPVLYLDLKSSVYKENNNTVTWDLGDSSFKEKSTLWNSFDKYQGGQKLPTGENLARGDGGDYVLKGWKINGSEETYEEIPVSQTGNITLTPVWYDEIYEIRYYRTKNDTTPVKIATRSYVESYQLTEVIEGYTSGGWKNKLDDKVITKVSANTDMSFDVYADKLTENTYTIKYYSAKDSSEVIHTETRLYSESKAISYVYKTNEYYSIKWKNKLDDKVVEEVVARTTKDVELYPETAQYFNEDTMWFGAFPQNDTTGEQAEPVKWRVIYKDGNEIYLIADKTLEMAPYHRPDFLYVPLSKKVIPAWCRTWNSSTLCVWLNGYFLSRTWTSNQLRGIINKQLQSNITEITGVVNDSVQYRDTKYISNERVFVFGEDDPYDVESIVKSNTWSRTPYAQAKSPANSLVIDGYALSRDLKEAPKDLGLTWENMVVTVYSDTGKEEFTGGWSVSDFSQALYYDVIPIIVVDRESSIFKSANNSVSWVNNGDWHFKDESTLWNDFDKYQGGQRLPIDNNVVKDNNDEGLKLVGWKINNSSRVYTEIPANQEGNITLEPVWSDGAYEVRYYLLKDDTEPVYVETKSSSEISKLNFTMSVEGHTVTGWRNKIDDEIITEVPAGNTDDIEVYAILEEKIYEVRYYAGKDDTKPIKIATRSYSEEYRLVNEIEGYNVSGAWISRLIDEQIDVVLSYTFYDIEVYNSNISENEYTIKYYETYNSTQVLHIATRSYTEAKAVDWTYEKDGTSINKWKNKVDQKTITEVPARTTTDIEVYADFNSDIYEIRYYASKDSTEVLKVATRSYAERKAVDFEYKITGYHCNKWKNKANDQFILEVEAGTDTDIEVYAEMEENIYEIRYFATKESTEPIHVATRSYTEEKAVDWVYEVDGYETNVWYIKSLPIKVQSMKVLANTASHTEVYAGDLKEKIYEIRYYAEKTSKEAIYIATRSYTERKAVDYVYDTSVFYNSEWRNKLDDELITEVAALTDSDVEVYAGSMSRTSLWFGTYPQNDASGTQLEPIKWVPLKEEGGDVLLLADKLLDFKKFNESGEYVNWEDSTIRSWLNNGFKRSIFTNEQLANYVVNKELTTDEDVKTRDQVFFLSDDEVKELLANESERVTNGTIYSGLGFVSFVWWLRSQDVANQALELVDRDGNILYNVGSTSNGAVRPAIYISLPSLDFDPSNNRVEWDLGDSDFKEESVLWNDFDSYIGGQKLPTKDNVVEKLGYEFDGWHINGSEEAYTIIPVNQSGAITLTPAWKELEYEIRYYAEKESTEPIHVATRSYTERKAVDYVYEVTGYHSSVWKNRLDDEALEEVAEFTTNDIEVYPELEENIYEIRYYLSKDDTESVKVATRSYTEEKAVDEDSLWDIAMYRFNGWLNKLTDVEVTSVPAYTDSDIEVYASLEEIVLSKEDVYFTLPKRIISNDDSPFTSSTDTAKDIIKPTKEDFVSELGLYRFSPDISAIEVGLDTTGLRKIQTIRYQTDYRRSETYPFVDYNYNVVSHDRFDPVLSTEVKAEVWYDDEARKYKINLIDGNDNWKIRDKDNSVKELFDYVIIWDLSEIGSDLDTAQQDKDYSKMRLINWELDGGAFSGRYAPVPDYEEGTGRRVDEFPTATDVYKKGYILDKWTLGGEEITHIDASVRGDITIVAVWRVRTSSDPEDPNDPSNFEDELIGTKFKITWDLGSSEASWAEENYKEIEDYEYGVGLRLPSSDEVVWYGHKFTGWNLDDGFNATIDVDAIPPTQKGPVTVIATWRDWDTAIDGPETYKIDWKLMGGIWQINDYPETYEYGHETPLPGVNSVIKDGYIFDGWYIGSEKATNISSTTRGKVSVEASWVEDLGGNGLNSDDDNYFLLPQSIIRVSDDSFTRSTDKGRESIRPTNNWAVELGLTEYVNNALGSYKITQNSVALSNDYEKINTIKYRSDYRRSTTDVSIVRSSDSQVVANKNWDVVREDEVNVEIWYDSANNKYIFNLLDGKTPSSCYIRKGGVNYEHEIIWDLSAMAANISMTTSWYENYEFATAKNSITKIHFVTEYEKTGRVLEEKTKYWNGSASAYTKGIIDSNYELFVVAPTNISKLVVSSDATNFFGITSKGVFEKVTEIEGLDKLDWSRVTIMDGMFNGMASIVDLDISDIDTSHVTDTVNMFRDMTSLETIYADSTSDFSRVTDSFDMFAESTKLIGGEGTVYDRDYLDVEYARIDKKETSNISGYFTDSSEKGSAKKYPNDGSDTDTKVTYYNLYWDLDGGEWRNYVASSSYAYGEGLSTLPTKQNVKKSGYTLSKWTYRGSDIMSISRTAKGSMTLKAVWNEGEDTYLDGEVRPDIYVDLPARLISTTDDGFDVADYKARDTIKPTKDWTSELSLSDFEGKIEEIGEEIDTNTLTKIQTIYYQSTYRRSDKFATTSDILGVYKQGDTGLTSVSLWDVIKESGTKAEVWWDETNRNYKIKLVGSEGSDTEDWQVKIGSEDVSHEVVWDLSDVSTRERYKIKWDKNSGQWADPTYEPPMYYYVEEGLNSLPGADDIVRYGYEFTGWSLNNITIVRILPGMRTNVTLVATWREKKVNVILDANTGTFDDMTTTRTVVVEEEGVIGFPEPTKVGYNFRRWIITDVHGSDVTVGSTWLTEEYGKGTKRVRAEWEPIQYSVEYDGVTPDEPYAMYSATNKLKNIKYGEQKILDSNVYTKDGYNFVGWSNKGSTIRDGKPISALTTIDGGREILSAKWEGQPVIVVIANNYKDFTMVNTAMKVPYGVTYSMDAATFDYDTNKYEFLYWKNNDGRVKFLEGSMIDTTEEKYKPREEYIARFIDKGDVIGSVKFDGGGGKVAGFDSCEIPVCSDDTGLEDIEPYTSRPGYEFIGWKLPDGSKHFDLKEALSNDNYVVTAQWSGSPFTLAYEANDGTDRRSIPERLVLGENKDKVIKSIDELGWSRPGYKFLGWISTKDPSVSHMEWQPGESYERFETFEVETSGDRSELFRKQIYRQTLVAYAEWSPLSATIQYIDENGRQKSRLVVYGQNQRLLENSFEKSGYTFIGWGTSRDGDVVYRDRDSADKVILAEYSEGNAIKLYAKYEVNSNVVNVTYNGNGGSINGFKTWTIPTRKSEGITNFEAVNGNTKNLRYIDADGNVVVPGTPLTKSIVVYADYGTGTIASLITTAVSLPIAAANNIPQNNNSGIIKRSMANTLEVFSLVLPDGESGAAGLASTEKGGDTKGNVDTEEEALTDEIEDNSIGTSTTQTSKSSTGEVAGRISSGSTRGNSGGSTSGSSSGRTAGGSGSFAANFKQPIVTEDRPTKDIYVAQVDTKSIKLLSISSQDALWIKGTNGKWILKGKDQNNNTVTPKDTFCQVIGDKATNTYYFNEKGELVTGWMKSKDGKWYYFSELDANSGQMAQGWRKIGSSWYYFNSDGTLFESGTTPDGETIGADGKWVKKVAA